MVGIRKLIVLFLPKIQKFRFDVGDCMRYELIKFFGFLYRKISRKSCSSCGNYDGRYGSDCCFECIRSIRRKHYERKREADEMDTFTMLKTDRKI